MINRILKRILVWVRYNNHSINVANNVMVNVRFNKKAKTTSVAVKGRVHGEEVKHILKLNAAHNATVIYFWVLEQCKLLAEEHDKRLISKVAVNASITNASRRPALLAV